jgi:phosphonate transport system ATP-binding protein
MSQSEPIFELKQVTQQFGPWRALSQVSVQIRAGERVALLGPSGAGKSTLIRLLNGTLLPSQGEVWALGRNLSQIQPRHLRQVQRSIGTVYQRFHLIDSLQVIHNVNAGNLGRWSVAKALLSLLIPQEIDRATQALTKVGIAEKIYTRTDELSGGQQQRVALARVLVQDPIALLADEPIASLDPELSREIMDLLRDLTLEAARTLVVSLHTLEFARSHCDRILGLRQGAIVFDSPSELVSAEMLQELYCLGETGGKSGKV